MKWHYKKFAAVSAIMFLVASLVISGCSSKGDKKETSAKSNEPVTLKILTQDSYNAEYSLADKNQEYPVLKEVEKRTGVKIEWEVATPGDNFDQVVETRMAAGIKLPDITYFGWNMDPSKALNFAKRGLIIPLNDLIKKNAPNITKAYKRIPEGKKDVTAPNGKQFWIGHLFLDDTYYATYFREDWLKKVGINKLPDNTEDMYKAAKAMHDGDANGNGKKDEIMCAFYWDVTLINIGEAFGVPFGSPDAKDKIGVDKNGKLYFSWLTPNAKDMLQYLYRWYKDGLIDPEIASMQYEKYRARLGQNVISVMPNYLTNGGSSLNDSVKGVNGVNYVGVPYIKGPKGDHGTFRYASGADGSKWAITKDCKNPAAAIKFLDFCYTQDYNDLREWGIEGVHYNKENGKYVRTKEFQALLDKDYSKATGQAGMHASSSLPQYVINPNALDMKNNPDGAGRPENVALMKQIEQIPQCFEVKLGIADDNELKQLDAIGLEYREYINEMTVKFFTGKEPFSKWDTFVKQANKLGAAKVIKVYQKMYDRYQSVK